MVGFRLLVVVVVLAGSWGLSGCQDAVGPQRVARLQQELKAIQNARDGLRRDLEAARRDLNAAHSDLETARRELRQQQEQLETLKQEVAHLQQERADLQEALANRTQERDLHAQALAELRAGIKVLLERVEVRLGQENPAEKAEKTAGPAAARAALSNWCF
jgi:chromosome segregation ATPase